MPGGGGQVSPAVRHDGEALARSRGKRRDDEIELEAALAIIRLGSFRAAALELGLSTTALSNAIAKLERQLGVRLFNRTTRSVSLTDAGRTFVERVGPAMTDIQGEG